MKKQSIFANLKKKDGSTLLMVLMIFLVLVVILMSASMLAMSGFRRSQTASKYSSAYYVAEAAINEFSDELGQFLTDNATIVYNNPDILGSLYAGEVYGSSDENVQFEYDALMNEQSQANVRLEYLGETEGLKNFVIKSQARIGDSTREVAKSFSVKVEIQKNAGGLGVDAPAIASIDLDNLLDPGILKLSSTANLYGPFLTNKNIVRLNQGSQNIYGPFETSGNFSLEGPINAVNAIIVGGNFTLDTNAIGQTKIKALIFKNLDSQLINNVSWQSGIKIEYLFVPTGYDLKNIKTSHQLQNGEWDISKQNYKIVYYNPENFDPRNSASYTGSYVPTSKEIDEIFGKISEYDYTKFFESDFILDNLDNPDIVEANIPNYTMPDMPIPGVTYPWIRQSSITMNGSTSELINDKKLSEPSNSNGTFNITLNESFSVNTIEFKQWKDVNLIVDNRNITIVTKSLKLQQANISVIGKGSLTIYVVGENGTVTNLVFETQGIVSRETIGGKAVSDSSRVRFIIGKSNITSPITFKDNGIHTINAVIISQDLNFDIKKHYIGIIISLKGTQFDIHNTGNSSFNGFAFVPNATARVYTSFKGSVIAKSVTLENSGPRELEYDGNIHTDLVREVLSYLEKNEVNNGSGTGTGPGIGGTGSGGANQTRVTINWSPLKEVTNND